MCLKAILLAPLALCFALSCRPAALAQGGWDVWTVRLRDGSRLDVAPVWSLDEKELRFGFDGGGEGKGTPLERRLIRHMSNILRNSEYRARRGADYEVPALPEEDFELDLVVLDDGRRVFGPVVIRAGSGEEGRPDVYGPVLVQNGVETDLTAVAHIKFAAQNDDSERKRLRHPRRSGRSGRRGP